VCVLTFSWSIDKDRETTLLKAGRATYVLPFIAFKYTYKVTLETSEYFIFCSERY
jgi:hypothetical protein